MEPEELILEDVRCFQNMQRGSLRPITLLLGENSTGKSTFLACFSVIYELGVPFTRTPYKDVPDFNREPFSMGSFRDIVRSRRGPSGRINEFKLGLKFPQSRKGFPTEIFVTFVEQGSQPIPGSYQYRFGQTDFIELRKIDEDRTKLSIPSKEILMDAPISILHFWLGSFVRLERELELIDSPDAKSICDYIRNILKIDVKRSRFGQPYGSSMPSTRLIPIAPLRAKPKRTYDPVRESDSPEGDHIPMLMMRLDHSEKSHWQSLHDDLVEFGKMSGLFSDIKVRRHGKQISDPFQLQLKIRSGSHANNIIDVGYGVSQSLPILVNLLSRNVNKSPRRPYRGRGKTFLLQQPEVHLHPRGQAELASLFAKCVQQQKLGARFLIETHSDYIVDRIRILVRNKTLKPEDVSIIFFDPDHNAVKMHNISLDKYGNLVNVPENYRSFFLKETDRLLGFED